MGKEKLFFKFLFLYYCFTLSLAMDCEIVSNLSKDFNNILPNYESLNLLHFKKYFFIENDVQMQFTLTEVSALKIMVEPRNVDMSFEIRDSSGHALFTKSSNGLLPLIYQTIEIQSGTYTLLFNHQADTVPNDELCNEPYFDLDIYIEDQQHFKERTALSAEKTEELEQLNISLTSTIKDAFLNSGTTERDLEEEESDTHLGEPQERSLPLKSISYYKEIGLQVLAEFNFEVGKSLNKGSDDWSLFMISDLTNESKVMHYTSIRVKLEMYFDFFLGGGVNFVLIKKSEDETETNSKLWNLGCVTTGSCVAGFRHAKNGVMLNEVLSHGEYLLLIVNFNSDIDSNRQLRKEISYIPVTYKLSMTKIQGEHDNNFDCVAVSLPFKLNIESDFTIKDNIKMDVEELKDSMEFFVREEPQTFGEIMV